MSMLIIAKIYTANPKPVRVTLAHDAPTPIFPKQVFNFIAQSLKSLMQPGGKLATVHTRIGFFVLTRLGLKIR